MAYLKITGIQSFEDLDYWMLRGSRGEVSRGERVVGYKTIARHVDKDTIAVRQWNTDIYVLNRDNIATLNVGDWFTVTTKQRLNDLLPPGLGIYSDKGRWYFVSVQGGRFPERIRQGIPFVNGIRVDVADGKVVADDFAHVLQSRMAVVEQDRENAAMKKKIAAYIKGLTDDAIKTLGEHPTGGDCLLCTLEANGGPECASLATHIEERYYFTTMFYNAVQKRGNPIICMSIPWIVRHDLGRYLRKRLLKGVAVA